VRWVAYLRLTVFRTVIERCRSGAPDAVPLAVREGNVVIEASPEAMAAGVQPGDLVARARLVCPDLVVVQADPACYRQAARAVWDVCARFTPLVEPDGERGTFLSLAGALKEVRPGQRPLEGLVRLLRSVAAESGFGAVGGLGTNRLIARIAADRAEEAAAAEVAAGRRSGVVWPFRVTVVRPGEERAFLAELPVDALWPLAPAVRERLRRLGIARLAELQAIPERELWRQFGAAAPEIARFCRGEDSRPVLPGYPQRTVEAGLSVDEPVDTAPGLEHVLTRLARQIARSLEPAREGCRWLLLELRTEDGRWIAAKRRFSRPQHSPSALRAALVALASGRFSRPPVEFRVTAGDLRPVPGRQLELFPGTLPAEAGQAAPAEAAREPWAAVAEGLEARYGARVVVAGRELHPTHREAMLGFWDPLRGGAGREPERPPGA